METNCDISSTTDNLMMSNTTTMPNHMQARPGLSAGAQMAPGMGAGAPQRGRSPAGYGGGRGRSPIRPQANFDMSVGVAGAGAGAAGGYNFQRIMDDHFEHYKRPASRERSVDPKVNMPGTLPEAPGALGARSGSRVPSRAPSRTRGTPLPLGASHTDMDLDVRRKEMEMNMNNFSTSATNGDAAAGEDLGTSGGGMRYRGGQPSQEVAHLGTIPKRTESLYLKQSLDTKGQVSYWRLVLVGLPFS